jgi:hypothetical protein
MGLRGQSFQIHGIDGQVYNLIIDRQTVVNSRFIFLDTGRCPAVAKPSNCWSHSGSYLGEIGITTSEGDRLIISSGSFNKGFSSVVLNDVVAQVGANFSGRAIHVQMTSPFSVSVTVGNFEIVMENSDSFINLVSVRVLKWSRLSALACHGLLGQTWRAPETPGQEVKHVEGWIDEYVEKSNDLLGKDFVYGL